MHPTELSTEHSIAAEDWDGCRYDLGVTGGVISMPQFLDKFFPEVGPSSTAVFDSEIHVDGGLLVPS